MRNLKYVLPLYLLLFGCYFLSDVPPGPTPDQTTLPNPHLFDSPNCISGCWQGLHPGVTTTADLISYLNQIAATDTLSTIQGGYTEYSIVHKDGFSVYALTEGDVLVRIELTGLLNLNLGDITNTLGVPVATWISYYITENAGPRNVTLRLYYPQSGYVFYFDTRGGLDITMISDTMVKICFNENIMPISVSIVESGSIENMVNSLIAPNNYSGATEAHLQDLSLHEIAWPGLECIEFPNPQP